MYQPKFTRKELRAASTKRPIDWSGIKNLPIRYNVALEDILKGESSQSSRSDIATLFTFVTAAKDLGLIDDGGLANECVSALEAAYIRSDSGKSFRLDGKTAEAIKEMIASFEVVVKGISQRDYMNVCNQVERKHYEYMEWTEKQNVK